MLSGIQRGPVKDQNEFLIEIVGKLSDVGVPYMVAGSYSSNIWTSPGFDCLRRWPAELDIAEDLERKIQDAAAVQRDDDKEGT